jgi:hypothetical protein
MNSDGSDMQLYNIVQDRNETANLAGKKSDIAEKLKKELLDWWNSLPKLGP